MIWFRLEGASLARITRWRASLVWLASRAGGNGSGSRPGAPPTPARGRASEGEVSQWFMLYQRPLLDYLYGMTRDREWAADLTQETFLRAYTAAGQDATAVERPRAWLYRIATNVAISALRHRRRFDWLPLSVIETDPSPGERERWRPVIPDPRGQDVAVAVVERDAVWGVLAELPPRWRAALLLQASAGFTPREVATELGVTEASARKMLFRAKERYRLLVAREAEAEAKGGAQ
jgi:RNA polymerase sigma-70 factor (ECF subfamily)